MAKFLKTFTITLSGSISGGPTQEKSQFCESLQALNLHYVNDKHVNRSTEKGVIGKYDSHPNFSKLQDSHANLSRANVVVQAKVGLDESGRLHLIEIV